MSLTKVSYSMIDGAVVNVKDFGATGDGVTNDTVAVQAAIDSLSATGGTVFFPTGEYRIARNIGVNDRWGVKVVNSNIVLSGTGAGSKLRRYNTDISTYALAYPIVFVGTPDSDVAAATENVTIQGLEFIGEDTQHSINGGAPHDFRNAIEVKNTKNLVVQNNLFTEIDSSVIWYQRPYEYDEANSVYYNKTKNYNSKFIDNSCIANAHAVYGRGIIHAIIWQGVDFCEVSRNYFEWCDDCVAGEGTYTLPTQVETDTWVSSIGAVKRSGRGWKFSENTVYNSSEHAVYAIGIDTNICDNYFYTDEPSICVYEIVKLRCRNVQVTGNVFGNYALAITIVEPSFDVNVVGNTIYAPEAASGLSSAAVIMVNSNGLENFYTNRPWFNTSDVMSNININSNTIQFPPTAASSGLYQIAFRVYTSASSTLFPLYELENVSISNNSIQHHKIGVYVINQLVRSIDISNNKFIAKTFGETGFNSGSSLNTYAALVIYNTSTSVGNQIKFNNNLVRGSEYLFSTYTGTGTGVVTPAIASNNYLTYIKTFKSADMTLGTAFSFTGNYGTYFLDRTGWFPGGINNSLNTGTNSSSEFKSMIVYNGTTVRFYTDDSLAYITLG